MTAEKLGYSLGPLLSTREILLCAKMADPQENVDSLWVPESWGRESFSTLGAISQITKKVRLGTSIVSIYSRTPATVVENWHGVRFNRPTSRMKEYIECLRLITKGQEVKYDGEFFRINNFKILHQPQRTHIPIFMAAINKKMVSMASELADGTLFYLRPFEELKKTTAELKQATKGKDFEIACSFICAISNKEPEKARYRAATTLAFYVAVGKYYSKFLAENGFKMEVEAISAEYRKAGVYSAAKLVSERMLSSLVICGSSEECRESLSRFLSTGITLPILQFYPVDDSENSFREMLSTF